MSGTTRLALRKLTREDAEWIARDIAHPEVHRWLPPVPHPYTLTHAQDFCAQHADHPDCLAIEWHGKPCGVISILPVADGLPELGYWLAFPHWGQGLMTRAAFAVVSRHFTQGGGPLGSGWIKGNAGSETVLMRLGARRTGEIVMRASGFHKHRVPVIRVIIDKPPATEESQADEDRPITI